MSDPVDRVASAIAEKIHGPGVWPWPKGYSSTPLEADDIRGMAVAAIAAMRAPSVTMVHLGTIAGGLKSPETTLNILEAMIDEALK